MVLFAFCDICQFLMYVDLDFFLVQENVYPNPLAMLICESSCSAVKCWYLLLGGSRSPGKDGVQ